MSDAQLKGMSDPQLTRKESKKRIRAYVHDYTMDQFILSAQNLIATSLFFVGMAGKTE